MKWRGMSSSDAITCEPYTVRKEVYVGATKETFGKCFEFIIWKIGSDIKKLLINNGR